MKSLRLAVVFFLMTTASAMASPLEEDHPFSFRLGSGATVGPETFFMMGSAEYNMDRFLGFGPMIQLGLGQNHEFYMGTLGGRLNIPVYPLEILRFSVHTGAGVLQRKTAGLSTEHFVYTVGTNADVFVWNTLTVGLGGLLNVTSQSVERFVGALYAAATMSF